MNLKVQAGTAGGGGGRSGPLALAPIREDLRLHSASPLPDGAPTWRVYDPVRNAFFEIGWLEFELMSRWGDHADADALIAQVSAETPLKPTRDEVEELLDFLAQNQLLSAQSELARRTLQRRLESSKQSWQKQVLHHYLFFRVPLFHPDRFLARTVWLTEIFFTRTFAIVVACVLGLDLYLLSREWYAFTDALARMLTPASIIYYAVALVFAKLIHELAHAYAARRYGVRVPTMGIAFLIMAPFPYTDTGETWKLGDRRKQLVIACAGMAAELALAVFSTLLWALSPEGAVKNVFFVLASTTWVMTLAINLSPFMRFDGYFVLSDLLNFPNLHERAGICAKWWLRRTFFRLDAPVPEPTLTRGQRGGLIVFAYVTWLYRLVVFLGIALLVYHMFFKLLGIILMIVELVWFIAMPIWRELVFVWGARRSVRLALRPLLVAAAVLLVLAWTVPISNQVSAPAVMKAAHEHAIYAPFAGRIVAIDVKEGAAVDPSDRLLELQATDLHVRERKADIGIAMARAEIARTPASLRQQERVQVLQEQLAQALAEKKSVAEERSRQRLNAPEHGVVRDVAAGLMAGSWVNPRQLLMRVVSQDSPVIEAYVGERQVEAIVPGQSVTFYPSTAGSEVVPGTVIAVDKWPQKELQQRLLSSTYGGPIAVKQSADGLTAQDAIFRVLIAPEEPQSAITSVTRGDVRIETDLRFVAENFIFRIIAVVIRESGI